MIRITLHKDGFTGWNGQQVEPRKQVVEFEDDAKAAYWFINASYFDEAYTRAAIWERIA